MPPLLLIHGMWGRPSTFAQLAPELEAAGIASIAPALPFHDIPPGAPAPAELARMGLADYVAAIQSVAATLPEPPVLLGHSMGGLIAQLAAPAVGPRGLILLATAPSAQTLAPSLAQMRTLRRVTLRWGWWKAPTLPDADAARYGVFNGVSEAETAAGIAELTWDSGRVLAKIALPFLDSANSSRVAYDRLTMPALVLFGSQDRIATAATSRGTARRLRGRVDFEEWPDCGHWFFHDRIRPRLAERIARFLASL
ncbi:MAG: alpha/beta fold hydrolase [Sphingomonadaceae bacterium]